MPNSDTTNLWLFLASSLALLACKPKVDDQPVVLVTPATATTKSTPQPKQKPSPSGHTGPGATVSSTRPLFWVIDHLEGTFDDQGLFTGSKEHLWIDPTSDIYMCLWAHDLTVTLNPATTTPITNVPCDGCDFTLHTWSTGGLDVIYDSDGNHDPSRQLCAENNLLSFDPSLVPERADAWAHYGNYQYKGASYGQLTGIYSAYLQAWIPYFTASPFDPDAAGEISWYGLNFLTY